MFGSHFLAHLKALRQNKRRPSTGNRPPVVLRVEPLEVRVVPSVTQLGSTIQGLQFSNTAGSTPPDPSAASGSNSVIDLVNTNLAIYNKSGGSPIFSQDLSSFFSSVRPAGSNAMSDPVVAYNQSTGQFFIGVLDLNIDPFFGTVNSDAFDYAVSTTSNPQTASDFTKYSVGLTNFDSGYFGDFPRLGWNHDAYVVTFNMFTTGFSETYGHPLVLSLNSTNPATGVIGDIPGGGSNATVTPTVMYGSQAGAPMYFVEETLNSSGNPTGNSITVVTETNELTTSPSFTFTPVSVNSYTAPPSATQEGSTTVLQTNDSRILNAQWRSVNGQDLLVASQNVGLSSDSQAHARWYELNTANLSSSPLVQQGTIGVGSGSNCYFPSIAIDPNGDLGMTYMESSPSEYVSMYVTGRTPSDPAGTMEMPIDVQPGQATYTGFDGSPYRAGDFSGITVDPSDGTFWAANEYATAVSNAQSTNWGSAIAHFQVGSSSTNSLPPTVTTEASASPSTVTGTTTQLSVTATDPNNPPENLTYTWSVLSKPSGAATPTFSSNNTTLASGVQDTSTATFFQAGSYTFEVTITNTSGLSKTSNVTVTVNQTLTKMSISPSSVSLKDGTSQTFTATTLDQFGQPMATQPTTFSWTKSGSGTLSPSTSNTDTYTAPSSGKGSATITVTSNGLSAKATVKFNRAFLSTKITTVPASANTTLRAGMAAAVNSGEPAGSALGPAVFLINDLFSPIRATTAFDAPALVLSTSALVWPRFDSLLSMGAGSRTIDASNNDSAHDILFTDPSL
jgi:hypothetical protein